ncbi:hypothetical protein VTK73DRAFT_5557 [Phialemonium thermophilum]|uniref:Transcription factor domain-containing protein n=1 Tax=Phialemonium thermophilum TaxID=223376 RepID=A0ABR3XXS9_9PEZI
MEIVWQSSKVPVKKRAPEACSSCRARKKRCFHISDKENRDPVRTRAHSDGDNESENTTNTEVEAGEADRVHHEPQLDHAQVSSTRGSSPSPGRESEYNPESLLADVSRMPRPQLEAASLRTSGPAQLPRRRGIVRPGEYGQFAARQAERRLRWYQRHRRGPVPSPMSQQQRQYLEHVGAFLELPRMTTDALLTIYNSLIDDLVPLADGAAVFRDYSNGRASPYLVKAMCLVACKTRQAAPFLRLSDKDKEPLPVLDFASKLFCGLEAAMKADLETDRVTKVRILALMHLNNDGPRGEERSSSYLSQAICEAWALSLHFNIPGNPDQQSCDLLWWTLRNLDRLNKPVMASAPFLIDDTDIAIDRPAACPVGYRAQLMTLSLRLGDLMAVATKVYKASSTSTVDDCQQFPSLSEITTGTGFDQFHHSHKAYLEIWYHVAAMLSCRYSGPATVLYNRRLTSADRVLTILHQTGEENLPPLPLVPYAMSMSTTTIYRALRDGQRDPDTACRDLHICCSILDRLSKTWTSAKGVTKLAKRLLSVLVKSDVVPRHSVERGEQCLRIEQFSSDAETLTPSTTDIPSIATMESTIGSVLSRGGSTCLGAEEHTTIHASLPVSLRARHELVSEEQLPESPEDLQMHLAESWPTYTHLDTAFLDLFDYGMPNVFRGPATWEFLGSGSDDGISWSDFQFSQIASPDQSLT